MAIARSGCSGKVIRPIFQFSGWLRFHFT